MRIVICAKTPWSPSICREHVLARSAAQAGHEVTFLEGPLDVRALRRAPTRAAWLRGARLQARTPQPHLRVVEQATLFPGQLSGAAQWGDSLWLRRSLRRELKGEAAIVVATRPWQWPAVAAVPAARRLYECGDDWGALIPGRAEAFARLNRRIAREADAVVLVSDALAEQFPGARLHVVPNGVDPVLADAPAAAPRARCLVYAGTISERFDAPFMAAVLERLPGWELELYGPCRYAGWGEDPAPELSGLLHQHAGRARWLGAVERAELPSRLDRAQVLVAPHRQAQVRGQNSMKLYDYACRGRPIVATPGALGEPELTAGAGVLEAATPAAFAQAVGRAAAGEGFPGAEPDWIAAHSWAARWRAWCELALADGPPS